MKRSAGILLPVFSLPSNYGIGTFGKEAYNFVDFLDKAKQSYWQLLPLGQTSYGDSPYQSFSSFAGNPYFIDLDLLVEDGLLQKEDLPQDINEERVDYKKLFNTRYDILSKAYTNGIIKYLEEFNEFCRTNEWLDNYAFFMALKIHFNFKSWLEWEDDEIRTRKDSAVMKYHELLNEKIRILKFIQFLFFKQYTKLKQYANEKGIEIIGDIPIYVSLDSCEVWEEPKNFKLDENYIPTEVSGVPPDYFNADGQLWGNPIYDYGYQAQFNYDWWVKRIKGTAKLYDVVRIDHFRGFESYWSVPYGETTAKNGHWVKGPGMNLLGVIKDQCKGVEFISEDLGYHTPEVDQLLSDFGYPGMKVLEFAFDSTEPSDHMPHNFTENYVCYIGTHDNEPVMAYEKNTQKDIARAKKYIGYNEEEGFNFAMIRCGMSSVAKLFVTQMQDYLGLAEESRINTPGVLGGNWTWRMSKDALNDDLANKIKEYTCLYCREKQDNNN